MEAATTDPPPRRRHKRPKETQDHTTTTAISDLPSDITCNIVSRLPLNSIFTCKFVCSSFRNLTLEPLFPRLHLPRSPLCLILHRRSDCLRPITFGFLPLDDSLVNLRRRRATMKFRTEIGNPAGSHLRIVNSCNGLICLADYTRPNNVCICNPITRQHFFVPDCKTEQSTMMDVMKRPRFYWYWYGFGYSRSTYLHKVVRFTANFEKEPYRLNCSIYTLGVDDEWRTLGNSGQPLPFFEWPGQPLDDIHRFVFCNGALHWIGREDFKLLLCYFDMEKEQCGNLPLPKFTLPDHLVENRFHLGVVDNCLYIRDCPPSPFLVPVNIWVMKDYGDVGSWTLEWIIKRPLPSGLDWDLKPIKTLEDGTVLMIVGEKTLASYNPVATAIQRISYHGVKFWKDSFTDVASFLPLP